MMKKTFKRALSLVLAILVLASMACVVASANSGQKANYNITDIITSKEGTYTYYFYMPDEWKNQYNDTYVEGDESSYSAGIYWWEGTGNCEDNPNAEGNGWPGYNVTYQVAPNVFVAHVPTDVTTIIWNNTVYGGTDKTLPEFTAAIQSSNIPSDKFDPNDTTDTYKFFPEGTESFDGMIYVCDPEATQTNEYSGKSTYKGSWLYYYGDGKYGVQKTLEEAEAANAVYSNGEFPAYGFQIDVNELTVYTNSTATITPNMPNCTATIADETIATIAQDPVTGVVTVTPVKVGTTTVTFTYIDVADVTTVTTKECVITVSEPPEVSYETILLETILLNESKTVNISTAGTVKYYQFTPAYSGTYEIYSSGDYDTYGYLYDSNMNELTYNDDGESGSNFEISYNLTAGTKYIIGAKLYDSGETGSFTITVTEKTNSTTSTACKHQSTWKRGKKVATYFEKGYTGDKVCNNCGKVVAKGRKIAKKVLATPKTTIKLQGNDIVIYYTKVKKAHGFEMECKFGSKKYSQKIKTTKSKTVRLSNIKSGIKATVRIRAFTTSGKKKAYSNWTKTKTLRIK